MHTYNADENLTRFGKLGFGESCDSEVLQRRTVQIRQKSLRTSFKRRCGSVGGAEQSICDVIGQKVLTGQVSNSILLNVLFQLLNVARILLQQVLGCQKTV